MKIIYRYLISKFTGPFVLTFFFALFILLMQYIWKYVDDLVGKGLEIIIILELLFYASATFVALAVPLAVLLSSLMAFGKLGENYEIVALKSAGIPLIKLYIPIFFFVCCTALFSFFFTNNIAPRSYFEMRSLLANIRDTKPALSIEEGVFFTGFDNFTIRVGKKDADNTTIYDIITYDHSKSRKNVTVTYAKKGKMQMTDDKKYMLFTLYDGFYWDESKNSENKSKYPLARSVFKEQYKRFDLTSFEFQNEDNDFYKTQVQALPNSEIRKEMEEMKVIIDDRYQQFGNALKKTLYYFDIYALQRNVIIDTFSSTPLCYYDSITNKQKLEVLNYAKMIPKASTSSTASTKQDIKWRMKQYRSAEVDFVFSIIGEKMAASGTLPILVGSWLSTAIFLVIGLFLIYKATIDSSLLSTEEYKKWFLKLSIVKKLRKRKDENSTNLS